MGEARRTRSVGTKLTEEEYAKLEALAAQRGVTPGECVRDLVLGAFGELQPADFSNLGQQSEWRASVAHLLLRHQSAGFHGILAIHRRPASGGAVSVTSAPTK